MKGAGGVSSRKRHGRLKEYPVPEPGFGQVLVRMKSSTICGSDHRLGHLPRASRQGSRGIPGSDRRAKTLWADRALGPGMRRFARGRPGHRLPYLGLRPMLRLPPGLHGRLHEPPCGPPMAGSATAAWRIPPRRREGPGSPARLPHLYGRGSGRLRLRHLLRGPREDRRLGQRRGSRHGAGTRGAGDADAREGPRRADPHRRRRRAGAGRDSEENGPGRPRPSLRRGGPFPREGTDRRQGLRAGNRLLRQRGRAPSRDTGDQEMGKGSLCRRRRQRQIRPEPPICSTSRRPCTARG